MSFLTFEGIGIRALSAALPKRVIDNYAYTDYFPKEEVREVVDKIGIYQRRFVDEHTCSSDLCFAAAEKLIEDNQIDRSEIDLLIFVSQTPDYRMPATSVILQDRLGLSQQTITFDVSMGCAGFLHGLSIVYSIMKGQNLRKALLLNGETRSKVYSPKDRTTAFIFGDAGVAALIERDERFEPSYFSLNSDGSRQDLIKINAGGYRKMSSPETLEVKVVDEYGNRRCEEHGYMKGGDVFNFVIREIPHDIKALCEYSGTALDDFSYYVFHQANGFINSHIARKLKLDPDRIPSTISKFGNTSSVSVPLTIVSELKGKPQGKVLLSAFGVGLTWGTAILTLSDCQISELVEI